MEKIIKKLFGKQPDTITEVVQENLGEIKEEDIEVVKKTEEKAEKPAEKKEEKSVKNTEKKSKNSEKKTTTKSLDRALKELNEILDRHQSTDFEMVTLKQQIRDLTEKYLCP